MQGQRSRLERDCGIGVPLRASNRGSTRDPRRGRFSGVQSGDTRLVFSAVMTSVKLMRYESSQASDSNFDGRNSFLTEWVG